MRPFVSIMPAADYIRAGSFLTAAVDTVVKAAPGVHMLSVEIVVWRDSEEVVVTQVSSAFSVADELDWAHVDFNYLPMDVVCNGANSQTCSCMVS
jgi:hypothetical protein